MIPAEKIQQSLREGYAFPCAMCVKLYWGKDQGLATCRAGVEKKECGGPLAGLGYPEYEGMLTRSAIANHCFRCGKSASKIVEGNHGPGYVGVCKRHLPMLTRVMQTDGDPWAPLEHEKVDR